MRGPARLNFRRAPPGFRWGQLEAADVLPIGPVEPFEFVDGVPLAANRSFTAVGFGKPTSG